MLTNLSPAGMATRETSRLRGEKARKEENTRKLSPSPTTFPKNHTLSTSDGQDLRRKQHGTGTHSSSPPARGCSRPPAPAALLCRGAKSQFLKGTCFCRGLFRPAADRTPPKGERCGALTRQHPAALPHPARPASRLQNK